MATLDLALIGNGTIGLLVDDRGDIVWGCFPRFDGDPAFCTLLRPPAGPDDWGGYGIEILEHARSEQEYLRNTPMLVTRLYDRAGGAVEILDFAPRFRHHGRLFCPMTLVRQVKRLSGNPRLRIRLRPADDYGARRRSITCGSNHIRFVGSREPVLRLTTDVSVTAIVEENAFFLEDRLTLLLGPDETVQGAATDVGNRFAQETSAYWREWVRSLSIPFEWQDAVIRAAITLQLNVFEDTGAVVAAVTTSIPEAAYSTRNWDYRYCWLRDAYFVINALNSLGATQTMERYLGYILNLVADSSSAPLRPVYSVSGHPVTDERTVATLPGYRGMGPVRVGNQAYHQAQHDVYGAAILAATHVFFDRRLVRMGDEELFRRLEPLGDRAATLFDQPDAGIWERRGVGRVHTFSSAMCWAACDRLARIALHLGLADRAAFWRSQAAQMHEVIATRSWNPALGSFADTMGGRSLDASLLRLNELGFVGDDDPRFAATVRAIGRELRQGKFLFRYVEPDDFGTPENAFLVCTFWYINALAALGERQEARALFEHVLSRRNRHGLLAEHIDPRTGEQWGNFVQTYSMVGLINSAIRLSTPWDQAF